MKTILKNFLLGAATIGVMSSCNDFLTQSSPSDLTEENVFNSLYASHVRTFLTYTSSLFSPTLTSLVFSHKN